MDIDAQKRVHTQEEEEEGKDVQIMKFTCSFEKSYKLASRNNVRCFPTCCLEGHFEKSFCGRNIETLVDISTPFDVEHSIFFGEFTTREKGPSWKIGDFYSKTEEDEENFILQGGFSHYIPNSTFAAFAIRPVVENHVRAILESPPFEVEARKYRRKSRTPATSSTTTTTTSTTSRKSDDAEEEGEDIEEEEEKAADETILRRRRLSPAHDDSLDDDIRKLLASDSG